MPEPAAVEYYLTRWQDAPKTTIELLNDHPSAVYAMLQFFYSCDYIADHGSSSNLPRLPPPVLHAEVYTLAEKYAIKTLSTLAKSNFGESLKEVEDSDLTQTVSKLYGADGDPHPLRADLLEAMKGRATELFALESEYIEFRKVAWSLPAFLGDVVQAITGPPSAKSTESTLRPNPRTLEQR